MHILYIKYELHIFFNKTNMNIIYLFKEFIYKIVLLYIFIIIQILFILNIKMNNIIIYINYTLKKNKFLTTEEIFIHNNIKFYWISSLKKYNKEINQIEFYTIETIFYKIFFIFILINLFVFLYVLLIQWSIIITNKKKNIYITLHFFTTLYIIYDTPKTLLFTNIKPYLLKEEKVNFYNMYLEPFITLESKIDTIIFYILLFVLKWLIITYYTFFNNSIFLNRIYISITILFFFNIDITFIILYFIYIEIYILIMKIINEKNGDGRN